MNDTLIMVILLTIAYKRCGERPFASPAPKPAA